MNKAGKSQVGQGLAPAEEAERIKPFPTSHYHINVVGDDLPGRPVLYDVGCRGRQPL